MARESVKWEGAGSAAGTLDARGFGVGMVVAGLSRWRVEAPRGPVHR